MNYKNLCETQESIDACVKRFYPEKDKTRQPILDGITDIERYLKSKLKICWVLKEPYEYNDGKGGGFDLKQMIRERLEKNHNFEKTWITIGYVSYSLLNNFLTYKQLEKEDKKVIMQSLLDISYINVGKMPAINQTSSPDTMVKNEYKIWAPILIWQLIKYNPDVIIFGNTFRWFQGDLKLKKRKNANYVEQYDKIFLDVPHPAVRGSKEDYCNSIINVVKKKFKNK
jgi:hypothetical protein